MSKNSEQESQIDIGKPLSQLNINIDKLSAERGDYVFVVERDLGSISMKIGFYWTERDAVLGLARCSAAASEDLPQLVAFKPYPRPHNQMLSYAVFADEHPKYSISCYVVK